MTDQTKKREEGEKRVNKAVIVAPTGSGEGGEEIKGDERIARIQTVVCPASPDTGNDEIDSTRE